MCVFDQTLAEQLFRDNYLYFLRERMRPMWGWFEEDTCSRVPTYDKCCVWVIGARYDSSQGVIVLQLRNPVIVDFPSKAREGRNVGHYHLMGLSENSKL